MSAMIAILPCRDLDASQAFYQRLGFSIKANHGEYRIFTAEDGAELHLSRAESTSLDPDHNPFGVYFYAQNVDELAAEFSGHLIGQTEDKPWGMYEFAMSDPDGALVRVGRPSATIVSKQ